jgi:hypothetical protein
MDLFDPEKQRTETERLRKKLFLSSDNFVLVYVGSWGTWYLTDEILHFFSTLATISQKARLLILTTDHPDLSNYAFASSVIIRNVARNDVPVFLGLGNASVCFIKPAFSKKASSATKMAEAWAMNLPVVTNSGWGDIDRLKEYGMPLLICNSRNEYHQVATSLINSQAENKRAMLKGKFDLRSGIQKYKSVYRSLSDI